MNKYHLTGLSVTGGVLSGLAWSGWCSGLILLISFVPFLIIENHLYRNQKRYTSNAFFIYLLPGQIIFSILALGWIRSASMVAAIAIITGISFLMSFVLWLAHLVRLRAGNTAGMIGFVSLWLSFEFLSLSTDYLSPWINLGNGLAKDILFIQWYEVTGTGGGTLWILCSNLFLSIFVIKSLRSEAANKTILIIWICILLIPVFISLTRYYTIEDSTGEESEVVIIQPNYDPFTEKFIVPFTDQLDKTLSMAENTATVNTSWIITPETTVDDPFDPKNAGSNKYIRSVRRFAAGYPNINIIAGMVTSGPFNSALQITSDGVEGIYHKSKLVPGFEREFSPGFGRMLRKILPDLGGTSWGYGKQEERSCFKHTFNGQIAGTVICYESVFGNYVAEYVRNGAEILFIITNDGWWKNTNGYKQHLAYASLRAIETRRPVARAANTGVSCLIDNRGRRISETEWWTEDVLKGRIPAGTSITSYVRHGDLILNVSLVVNVLIAVFVIVIIPLKKVVRRHKFKL